MLATGSKWAGPVDYPEDDADIRQFISQWQQRFKSAEDVVIVGGGAVGIGTWEHSSPIYFLTDSIRFCRTCWRAPRRIPCKHTFRFARVQRPNADWLPQDKKVTIIQGTDKLLNDAYPDKFRKYMEAQLRARKIDLILGEYADQFPPSGSGELVFRSGRKINAGLVVSTSFACIPIWATLIIFISTRPSLLVRSQTLE